MQDESLMSQPPVAVNTHHKIAKNATSSAEEYPLRASVTGHLKDTDNGNKLIITSEDGDYELILSPKSEIFRNGKRAAISDIEKIDLVSALGRKKTQESREISVNSIYANTDEENVSVKTPL
jgi:hypothetical protein